MKKLICFCLVFLLAVSSICAVSAVERGAVLTGDENGETIEVTIKALDSTPTYIVYCIDQEEVTYDMIQSTYVKVNGKTFTNFSYIESFTVKDETFDDCVIVKVPINAKVGDIAEIHFVMIDGTDISETDDIEEGDDEVLIDECDIHHAVFYYMSDDDVLKSIDFRINGKKAAFSRLTKNLSDYDAENFKYAYVYQAKYNIPYNSKITVTATTAYGYTYTDTAYAEDVVPPLSVNDFYSGDTEISGKTKGNSTVIIKAGKTYKAKAKASGVFKKKIKAMKAGKSIKITVKTTTKQTTEKKIKVKKTKGKAKIKGKIKAGTKKVKIKLTNAKASDKIKLKIGKTNYKYNVKSPKKKTTITIKTKNVTKGSKVKVEYRDKFNAKKSTVNSKVK